MKRFVVSGVLAGLFLISVPMNAFVTESNPFGTETFPFETDGIILHLQEEYQEIEVGDVPQAVTDAVVENYGEAKVVKAYVNEDEVYKLDLQTEGNEETETVYFSKDGKEIEA